MPVLWAIQSEIKPQPVGHNPRRLGRSRSRKSAVICSNAALKGVRGVLSVTIGHLLDPTARKLTREAIATVSAQNSRGVAGSTQLLCIRSLGKSLRLFR